MAAAVTLYGFFALFAIGVLAVAVIGFVAAGNRGAADDIARWLGVEGSTAHTIVASVDTARRSRHLTTVVGALGLLWVGSGFAVAVAETYDAAWSVPHRGARSRAVGLVWLVGAAVLLGAGGFVTAGFTRLPTELAPLVLVVSLTVDTGLFVWTSWVLPNRHIPLRSMLGPAVAGAVGLEVLKVLGAYVVPRLVENSSALYGTIGAVLGMLTWMLMFGRLIVFVTVAEVVAVERSAASPNSVVATGGGVS